MSILKVIKFLTANPGYLKWGKKKLAKKLDINADMIMIAKKFILTGKEKLNKPRILVIADTHLPYEKEGYLEFCKKQYDDYKCNQVIHIGDICDTHTTSRHSSLPDAPSPGDELNCVIHKLKSWYKIFPDMKVCLGNHDTYIHRAAIDGRIASKWIKGYAEVLEVPNWEFKKSYTINNTTYIHGTGTSGISAAYKRALNLGQNIVMGHLHSEASIIYHKLPGKTIFGMIVGSGIDQDSYGMQYAKNYPKQSIISCGLVLEDQPLIKIME